MVTLAILIRLASILVAAAETGLNISFWERLDRPAVAAAGQLRLLKRNCPMVYVFMALVMVSVIALLAVWVSK